MGRERDAIGRGRQDKGDLHGHAHAVESGHEHHARARAAPAVVALRGTGPIRGIARAALLAAAVGVVVAVTLVAAAGVLADTCIDHRVQPQPGQPGQPGMTRQQAGQQHPGDQPGVPPGISPVTSEAAGAIPTHSRNDYPEARSLARRSLPAAPERAGRSAPARTWRDRTIQAFAAAATFFPALR